MLVEALNSHLNLQRYKILYICGRSSSRLDRRFVALEINSYLNDFRIFRVYLSSLVKEECSKG